jgi:hypothetical protein
MNDLPAENVTPTRFNSSKATVIASLIIIPVSYAIYVAFSGENHLGQGLEHPWFPAAFWGIQAGAFLGLTLAPCLRVQSERRQGLLMFLAIIAFLADEALSYMFIAFNSFPD